MPRHDGRISQKHVVRWKRKLRQQVLNLERAMDQLHSGVVTRDNIRTASSIVEDVEVELNHLNNDGFTAVIFGCEPRDKV